MVPSIGADLSDPVDILVLLLAIQGHIEVQRTILGFLVCPHPEKLPVNGVANLRTKLPLDLTQTHDVLIDRLIKGISLRLVREVADHLVARHSRSFLG